MIKSKLKESLKVKLILVLSIFLLVGCAKKDIVNESNNIYTNKTEYLGDNSKVVSIVSSLEYSENFKYNSVELKSQKKPYTLIVYLDEENPNENIEFFKQAAVTFSLIDNLDEIKYKISNTDILLEEFNREDVDLILRENGEKETKELGKSEKELNKFIEKEI